jgi:hypothetical protein
MPQTATGVPIVVGVVLQGLRREVTSRLAKLASQKMDVRSVKPKLTSLRHSNYRPLQSTTNAPAYSVAHPPRLVRRCDRITVLAMSRTIDVRKLSVDGTIDQLGDSPKSDGRSHQMPIRLIHSPNSRFLNHAREVRERQTMTRAFTRARCSHRSGSTMRSRFVGGGAGGSTPNLRSTSTRPDARSMATQRPRLGRLGVQ